MNARKTHIVTSSIRIFLMLFWLYVVIDKLWSLPAFHKAMERQPFPDWWADILFWLLPLIELLISLLFYGTQQHPRLAKRYGELPFSLSAILLLIFTIYIALGVAGLYEDRPCGCASILSGLSWGWHLLVNIVLLIMSLVGWYLQPKERKTKPAAYYPHKKYLPFFYSSSCMCVLRCFHCGILRFKLYKRLFALFPGYAGININYDT